jgi:hypothetical protein
MLKEEKKKTIRLRSRKCRIKHIITESASSQIKNNQLRSRSPIYDDAQRILEFVLKVCRLSGIRGHGIFSCMNDNSDMAGVMSAVPGAYERFPWIDGCIEANAILFDNIVSALRPTFPKIGIHVIDGFEHSYERRPYMLAGRDYSRHCMVFQVEDKEDRLECLRRFISTCVVSRYTNLPFRLNENRVLLRTLYDHSDFFDQCLFIESWLEDIELFLCNINSVIRRYYSEIPGYYPETHGYPALWPGKNISRYIMPFHLQDEALSVHAFFDRQKGGPWHHE